jgi:chemotaxis protein CheD
MFHPLRRIGAICHGLLPECREGRNCRCNQGCENGFRNMACSIRMMFDRFLAMGIPLSELEVKVFGGSDMFDAGAGSDRKPTVGRQNVEITLRLLKEARVRIVAVDLGGERGRKIFFNTQTGEVLLKRLRKTAAGQQMAG